MLVKEWTGEAMNLTEVVRGHRVKEQEGVRKRGNQMKRRRKMMKDQQGMTEKVQMHQCWKRRLCLEERK